MGKTNVKAWLRLALIFMLCLSISGAAMAATLRVGSSGEEVKTLQTKLKRWGYYTGSIDGVFGSGTKKAVIAFQKKNGLTPDGVVGQATAKALGMSLSGGSSGSSGGSSTSERKSISVGKAGIRRGERRAVQGAGGRGGCCAEQGEEQQIPQQRERRDIPKRRIQRGKRRADKPYAG